MFLRWLSSLFAEVGHAVEVCGPAFSESSDSENHREIVHDTVETIVLQMVDSFVYKMVGTIVHFIGVHWKFSLPSTDP